MLHPQLKLEYFKQSEWPTEWTDEVVRLAREHFDKYYKPKSSASVAKKPVRSDLFCKYLT